MPEIDASIPLRAVPQPYDPLATVGKVQGVQQGILQNRLLGQQIGGKEALGAAITAATDPATGQTDWQKGLGLLAGNPKGAFAVPELAASVQDRQLKDLGIDQAQLELAGKRWTKVGDTAGSLLADKEPLTRDGVIKILSDNLVGSGMFNDQQSIGMLTNFVQTLPNDDAGIRAKLNQVYLQSGMTAERIAALRGTPTNVDTGGNIVNQSVSPLTGEVSVNGAITKGRSPSEKAALVSVYDPATQSTQLVPSGALVGDAAPGMAKGPVAQAGPALGEAEGASGAAAGAVQQAQALRVTAEKVPEVKAALSNIRDQLGKFQPGPKANWTYQLGALSQMLGVAPPKVTEGVAAQEEFNKLATQFINSQVGALGGSGTDAKLESARHGSPNEFMSKEGIVNVTNLMLGLNDALGAKNEAWQRWLDAGNGPESYGKFQTQFNKIYNPRVFQSVYMTDAQRQNMMSRMSKDERTQFQKDWTTAKKAGWLQ
jgi:hypothetical protein